LREGNEERNSDAYELLYSIEFYSSKLNIEFGFACKTCNLAKNDKLVENQYLALLINRNEEFVVEKTVMTNNRLISKGIIV